MPVPPPPPSFSFLSLIVFDMGYWIWSVHWGFPFVFPFRFDSPSTPPPLPLPSFPLFSFHWSAVQSIMYSEVYNVPFIISTFPPPSPPPPPFPPPSLLPSPAASLSLGNQVSPFWKGCPPSLLSFPSPPALSAGSTTFIIVVIHNFLLKYCPSFLSPANNNTKKNNFS